MNVHDQILSTVKNNHRFLITFKNDFSGDLLASAAGLFLILKKIHKDVDIICDDFALPKKFEFLPGIQNITAQATSFKKFIISLDISQAKIAEFDYDITDDKLNIFVTPKNGYFQSSDVSTSSSQFKYDTIITLGTPDLEKLGKLYDQNSEFFYQTPIINIDNSPDNEHYGHINHVQITATSVAEIIFNIFDSHLSETFDENSATCILAGIISATKSFKGPQVTPQALEVVGKLIALGARREEIVQNLYRTKSLETLKIWGKVLSAIRHDAHKKILWAHLTDKNGKSNEFLSETMNELIDELISYSQEAKIIALSFERMPGTLEFHILTEKGLHAGEIASHFQGQGTPSRAHFMISAGNIQEAEKEVIEYLKKMGTDGLEPSTPTL